MRRPCRRALALLLLVLHVGACTYWQPTSLSPRQVVEQERPRRVRVTTVDGEQQHVRRPRVRSDSLASGDPRRAGEPIPLSEIRSLEIQRFSGKKTLGLVLVVGVVGLGGTYIFLCAALCGSS